MSINMSNLVKQVQEFQQKMAQVQDELSRKTVTSTVGGGMVTVVVNGRHELLDIQIEREVIDPENAGILQDLIRAAVNDAMAKARDLAQQEVARLTGGINLPGLF